MAAQLSLDNIISAAEHFTREWSEGIESNKAFAVFRYVTTRLYYSSYGNMRVARLTFAQTSIAEKLNLSRRWVGEMLRRLRTKGWLTYYSPKLPDGTNGSTVFAIGNTMKRLLIMLSKSPTKKHGNDSGHFLRSHKNEKSFSTPAYRERKDRPLKPETLRSIPLLKIWLDRH